MSYLRSAKLDAIDLSHAEHSSSGCLHFHFFRNLHPILWITK